MADEVERIRIEIDDTDATKAQSRVNSGLDSMETKAGEVSAAVTEAVDNTSRKILSMTQASQNRINQLAAAAERKAAFATATPVGRLEFERNATLKRVAGDEQAVGRVTVAYERLIAVQRRADNSALLDRATAASKRGEAEANRFTAALNRLNSEQAKTRRIDYETSLNAAVKASQRASAEAEKFNQVLLRINRTAREGVSDIQKRAIFAGKTGVDKLEVERQIAVQKFGNSPANQAAINASFGRLKDVQSQNDYNASLQRAIVASQRATADSDKFAAAFARVNRQKAASIELDAKTRQSTVADAVRRAATPLERVAIDRASALSKVGSDAASIAAVNSSFDKLAQQAANSGKSFGQRVQEFFRNPIKAVGDTIDSTTGSLGKFGLIAGGAFIAVGLAAREAFSAFSDAARAGKDTEQLASRLGVTTQEALKLDAMAKISRVDISAFEFSMRRLSQALVDGGEEGKRGAKALAEIGVNSRESNGDLKGTYQLFTEIGKSIENLGAPERTAKLAAIFGRGAITLEPMIAHFHELDTLLDGIGIKLDDNLVKKLSDADTKIAVLGIEWMRVKALFAEGVLVSIKFTKDSVDALNLLSALPQLLLGIATGPTGRPEAQRTPTGVAGQLTDTGDTLGNAVDIQPGSGAVARSIARGDAALAAFKARSDTATAIQAEITRLESKTREDEAKLQPGLFGDVQIKQIAAVQADRAATEAAKERLKILNEIPNRIKQAGEYADASARLEHTGIAKVIDDYKAKRLQLIEGITDAKALLQINTELSRGANIQIGAEGYKEQRKQAAEIQKAVDESNARENAYNEAKFSKAQAFAAETLKLGQDTTRSQFSFEETLASQSRDRQIRAIENTDAKTLEQKVGFEIAKGRIEAQYIQTRLAVQTEADRREAAFQISQLKAGLDAGAIQRAEFESRSAAITAQSVEREKQLRITAIADVSKAQQDAAIKAADAVRDANTRVFDSFKHESEGIFDAMLHNGQSVFGALGNALKNAMLTAVKDIVSTRVAQGLTSLFTGQNVGLTPGTVGTGPLAKIGAALGIGARPTFGTTQSKIDQVGLVGDAMRVYVANPEAIKQTVDIKSNSVSRQVNQAITVGGNVGGAIIGTGGAGFRPTGAIFAVLAGLAAAAAPVAAPGGFSGVPTGAASANSTNITYDGGAPQDLGGKIQLFGEAGGGGFAGANTGGSLQDILGGTRNAFTGGSVDARGIPVNQASEQLSQALAGLGIAGIPGATTIGQGSAGGIGGLLKSGLGGLKGLFGLGTKADGTNGTLLTPSRGIGEAGLLGKGAAIAASPLATALGFGILSGALKNPYGKGAPFGAAGGGALAGFGIGAQIPGVGGVFGAEIGAGAGLLINGLQRGGVAGFGEDIAGGALAGFGIAGPIGAAVGAGVGALLGGLSLAGVIKTSNQKFHDKIKAIYGVNITDSGLLSQFTQIAKSKYGGNVDVAVRSLEVREIVQLYAQAHGQNSLGIVGVAQQSIFSNTGGKYTQVPTYFNGQAVVPGQTQSRIGIPQILPNGGYITIPNPSGANVGPSNVSLSLDAATTTALLQGQAATVIANQPRLISAQTQAGMGASSARRDIASSVLSPNFVTA